MTTNNDQSETTTPEKHVEMEQAYRERACRLLFETGTSPGAATQSQYMAAYQAVLTRDLLRATTELLRIQAARGASMSDQNQPTDQPATATDSPGPDPMAHGWPDERGDAG